MTIIKTTNKKKEMTIIKYNNEIKEMTVTKASAFKVGEN